MSKHKVLNKDTGRLVLVSTPKGQEIKKGKSKCVYYSSPNATIAKATSPPQIKLKKKLGNFNLATLKAMCGYIDLTKTGYKDAIVKKLYKYFKTYNTA